MRSKPPVPSLPRGFTLVELMVTVVIIAVMAVLAVPAMRQQLRNRRTEQAALEVLSHYRNAHMQTQGRGSAVLFRFNNGAVTVLEAIRGGQNAACAPLPNSACNPARFANPTMNREIARFDPSTSNHYEDVTLVATGPAPATTELSLVDVCFTPTGRTLVRYGINANFTPLSSAITISAFESAPDGTPVGLTRRALLLPNGSARLGVAQ